jgi:hypothetical protein
MFGAAQTAGSIKAKAELESSYSPIRAANLALVASVERRTSVDRMGGNLLIYIKETPRQDH